jgi:hypothetical protein
MAKGMKSEFHKMMATAVFSVNDDANIRVDFHSKPVNYTTSVDNYITWYVYSFISLLFTMTPLVQAVEHQ